MSFIEAQPQFDP